VRAASAASVLAAAAVFTLAAGPATALAQAPAPASAPSAASATVSAVEFEPVTVPMPVRQVAPHTYYVLGQSGMVSSANQGFNSNAGFVVTPEGVVVFDALGTPALGRRLAERIAETTPQPIRRVVISHYHSDHFYGLQALMRPGVDVWAHALVRDYLATDAPAARLAERRQSLAPWVNAKSRIVEPDRYVGDDTVFRLGGFTFRVMHAGPAHTPEDLMMLVEEEGVLFVGDLMFTGRIPFVADADTAAWIAAIDRVLAMKPKIVVGGHGPESTHAVADLALTRDYLVYLRQQIGAAFDDGLDFEAAYRRIDWSRFAALPAFEAANRRNAYQTYLNIEQDALDAVKRKAPAR
jgi:glyoxylase-like metal-dependent hydrolase (beta-lactamase superfamily II)